MIDLGRSKVAAVDLHQDALSGCIDASFVQAAARHGRTPTQQVNCRKRLSRDLTARTLDMRVADDRMGRPN